MPRQGSLRIRDARKSDAGKYSCHAQNGVIPGLSKVIQVSIMGKCF